jgi:hypothetical protein
VSEQDIQSKIITWLRTKGAHVTKYNAGAYGKSGEPDVFASMVYRYPGLAPIPLALYIEVKTATGKLSLIQQIKTDQMIAEGHWVVVARSIEDVSQFLAEKGVFL